MPENKNTIHFSLGSLNDGAIESKLMEEVQNVANNIFDPNTDPKAKRIVTLKLTMNSADDLKTIQLVAQVTSKMAPSAKTGSTLLGGLNANGEVELSELKSAAPGQMMVDVDTGEMLVDTGLPVAEQAVVIDMQTAKEAN
ncbi:hypothetical protein GCM10025878_14230 [Leuconostoc gasicomitatum]|uniref:Replication terminator protein n=1 Tax=Leuconostoc gasicomitatum TaxID=115778 RepID=A0ABP2B3S6_9LACO|nr:hypothetical protein [Leuconostoc gasicomitatum]GMA06352.1 hypothetical protein GCM10025878_14230 [Leuconostoc gasicomitatum]CBL92252.1 conserved hypothetical protein [Leuconostoc gasicomitatum LMG 18811]CUW10407.1 hypothetical protein C122C_0799 [Leuconostoc gasicomitatum]